MKIIFILYKTAVPGNIGAAARALNTMGFDELRLIEPCDHLADEALMLAHGSHDILKNAKIYDNFMEAAGDLDFIVGTTAKKRMAKEEYITPVMVTESLEKKKEHLKKVGIVFGTEESGLPNDIIQQCDIASTVPLRKQYPSLNLAQAVMLYAYELSFMVLPEKEKRKHPEASYAELKNRIRDLLPLLGIPEDMPLYHRILERVGYLDDQDINLVHSVSSRINDRLGESKGE